MSELILRDTCPRPAQETPDNQLQPQPSREKRETRDLGETHEPHLRWRAVFAGTDADKAGGETGKPATLEAEPDRLQRHLFH
jgi:hypothetical protein